MLPAPGNAQRSLWFLWFQQRKGATEGPEARGGREGMKKKPKVPKKHVWFDSQPTHREKFVVRDPKCRG